MLPDEHNAPQSWMVEELGLMFARGFLQQSEWELLRMRMGATISGFAHHIRHRESSLIFNSVWREHTDRGI